MRKLVPNQLVYSHVNYRPSMKDIERYCNVTLRAGATYEDIPKDILPDFLQRNLEKFRDDSSYKYQYRGRFGRQSVDQSFKVVTTKGETARSSSWIGNAVPVPLARALGNELWKVLQSKPRISNKIDNNQKTHEQEIAEKEMDQGDIDAMENIGESIVEESVVISNEDMDDEEDIELEDESIQDEYAEEAAMVISDEDMDDEDTELEDDTGHSSDSGEKRTAMKAINESDQDIIMVDEENVDPKDEVEQNLNAEENAMGSMMEKEKARRKTGESTYDAIVLHDSD